MAYSNLPQIANRPAKGMTVGSSLAVIVGP
jgi:hypothetical protein